jgi:hypothetical protein
MPIVNKKGLRNEAYNCFVQKSIHVTIGIKHQTAFELIGGCTGESRSY